MYICTSIIFHLPHLSIIYFLSMFKLVYIVSAKTWSDIWSMDLEDLSIVKERIEWKNDPKYQKVLRLVDLCQKYGVIV